MDSIQKEIVNSTVDTKLNTVHSLKQAKINALWGRFLKGRGQPHDLVLAMLNDSSLLWPVKFIHEDLVAIKKLFFRFLLETVGSSTLYFTGYREESDKNLMSIVSDLDKIDFKDPTIEKNQFIHKRILTNVVQLMLTAGGDTNPGFRLAYIATHFLEIPPILLSNIMQKYQWHGPAENDQRYRLAINKIVEEHKAQVVVVEERIHTAVTDEELHALIPTLNPQDLLRLFENTANTRLKLFDSVRETLRVLIADQGHLLQHAQWLNQDTAPYSGITQVKSMYICALIKNGICENPFVQLLKTLNATFEQCADENRLITLLPIASYVNNLNDIHYSKEILINMIRTPLQINKLYEISTVTLEQMSEMAVRSGEGKTDTDCFKQYLAAIQQHMQDELVQDVKLETALYRVISRTDSYWVKLPKIQSCENELQQFLKSIRLMQDTIASNVMNLLKTIQHNTQEYNKTVDEKVKFLGDVSDNLAKAQISEQAQEKMVNNNMQLIQLNSKLGQANSRLVFFNHALIMARKPHAPENRIMQNPIGESRIISLRCLSDEDLMGYLSSKTHLTAADIAQLNMSVNESSKLLLTLIAKNPGANNQALLTQLIDAMALLDADLQTHSKMLCK